MDSEDKIHAKLYSDYNQNILVLYLSEVAKYCYEKHLIKKSDQSETLSKQIWSASSWQETYLNSWFLSFKKTIEYNVSKLIIDDVDKLLIIKKYQKPSSSVESKNYLKIYGMIYSYIKEVCLQTMGSDDHIKPLDYLSKKELEILLEDLRNDWNISEKTTLEIKVDTWNNQKTKK